MRGEGDFIVEPAVPIPARDDQFGKFLGAHLNAVNLDCRKLLLCDLVDSAVDRNQLRMGAVNGTAQLFDLLTGQRRIDLRHLMLDGFYRALKLADTVSVTGKQSDG